MNRPATSRIRFFLGLCLCALPLLAGCAAQTGIPGHGGGKRFAVEQELVAAATRTAIKQIDLAPIRGKRVNLYINAMGDSGAGNLTGGRFSIISQLHGDYVANPKTVESYIYPRYNSSSTSTSTTDSSNRQNNSSTQSGETVRSSSNSTDHSTTTQTTESNTLLGAPISVTSREAGGAGTVQLGMKYEGLGAYHNSEELTSDDLQYLTAIVETYMFLQGVVVSPPSEAEVDVYITVDVYGTVYTRVDWFFANNEILKAKTGMEIFAVDAESGKILMEPRSAVAEAEYNEQYILWAGPVSIRKSVKKGDPLLADFSDAQPDQLKKFAEEREEPIPVPFQHRLGRKRGRSGGATEDGRKTLQHPAPQAQVQSGDPDALTAAAPQWLGPLVRQWRGDVALP